MIKIPKEITDEYGIIYEPVNLYGGEEGIYRAFLTATDYEIIKGFESLLTEPSKLLTNIVNLAKTLKDLTDYRKIAREEILKSNM